MIVFSPLCEITLNEKDLQLTTSVSFYEEFEDNDFKARLEIWPSTKTPYINLVVNFLKISKRIVGKLRYHIGYKDYSPDINIDYDVPRKSDDIELISYQEINELLRLNNGKVTIFLEGKLNTSNAIKERKPFLGIRVTSSPREFQPFPIKKEFFKFETFDDKEVIMMSREAITLERNYAMRWQIDVNARAGLLKQDVHVKFYLLKRTKSPIKAAFTFRIEQLGGEKTDWITKSFIFTDSIESKSFFIASRKALSWLYPDDDYDGLLEEPTLVIGKASFSFIRS